MSPFDRNCFRSRCEYRFLLRKWQIRFFYPLLNVAELDGSNQN